MEIANKIRAMLQEKYPRVHAAVDITVRDNVCTIMLGVYSLELKRRPEGGFHTRERWERNGVLCGAGGYSSDTPNGLSYFHKILPVIDHAVFLHASPLEPVVYAKYPLIEHYIKPVNDTAHRLWFSSDQPGMAHVETFIRAIHDTRAVIWALLPQPIAEEVIEHYAP